MSEGRSPNRSKSRACPYPKIAGGANTATVSIRAAQGCLTIPVAQALQNLPPPLPRVLRGQKARSPSIARSAGTRGLTLVPALLAILGERAFWPRSTRGSGGGRFWRAWATGIVRHPWAALILTVAVLAPPAIFGYGQAPVSYTHLRAHETVL